MKESVLAKRMNGESLRTHDPIGSTVEAEGRNHGPAEAFVRPKGLESNGGPSLGYLDELIGIIFRLEGQLRRSATGCVLAKIMVEGLAHDLRNPLAVIRSCSQFLQENSGSPSLDEEDLAMIRENAEKASCLLDQFLNFTKVSLTFQSLDLNRLIRETWKSATAACDDCKIIFKPELAEDLPRLFADQEKIERVLLNLFSNAVEASAENSTQGIVTVQTRLLDSLDMIEITIIDNGRGIPKNIREKIFKPYFTTKETGNGLGLHISQHFVHQHKGEISIENHPKGGAKVTLRFPVFLKPELN